MKKTIVLLSAIFLFSGCMSPAERQAKINQLSGGLEQERQRLDIPESIWDEYLRFFKQEKCGGGEYQWGKNWRYWAIKDAEKYLWPYRQRQNLIATFKEAYPNTWKQKLLEYDLQQQAIWAIRQEHARQDRQKSWREFGEAIKKNQEYPKITPLSSYRGNYWQEKLARQRILQGH